ncbi:MAG: hypothetical protein ACOC3T_00030 [Bacteroidota bacterium]
MTTQEAAARYEAEFYQREIAGRKKAIYNPHNKPIEELPTIYGFNNGGNSFFQHGCIIAEDGTAMGGHACSSEVYMLGDLGIMEGSRPDRHERFREHYPNGYKMEFVSAKDVLSHKGLMAACEKNNLKIEEDDKIQLQRNIP